MIKKALSFIMIISIVLIGFNSLEVNANENYDSKYIKIGLTREIQPNASINLTGNKFIVGHDNGDGVNELFKTDTKRLVAKIKNFSYHIELSDDFSSYNNALIKAEDLKVKGLDSYVVYKQGFKVYIGEYGSENIAKQIAENNNVLKLENTNVSSNLSLISIENSSNESLISFDENQGIFIKSIENVIEVENKKYRGYIGFINNDEKLTTVNYIQIGEYLKGVLPGEMPAGWEMEALKAQAVSSRNFTLRTIGKHKDLGYDLCDSQNCQMYYGHRRENLRTNQAIDDTRNEVLRYNGKIAETFYYSCSGGYTSSNENVWEGTPVPYLRGKRDPYSVNTPQSNWTYTISKADASNVLKAKGYDVGQITSLETIRDSSGERVLELKVTGTKGTKILPKETVRAVLGYGNIKSTNYKINRSIDTPIIVEPEVIEAYVLRGNNNRPKKTNINNVNVITADGVRNTDINKQNIVLSNGVQTVVKESNKGKGKNIVFKGSGWGHGVGMSQYGAKNMAIEGFDFKEILEFYFTDAKVE